MPNRGIVSIVDDDRSIRRATRSLVRSLGWDVRVYESAEAFLDADPIGDVACIISDVHMKASPAWRCMRPFSSADRRLP